MNGIDRSIFLWGLICLIGFGVYQFFLGNPSFPNPLILWSVLVVIGVAAMVVWVSNWMKNKVVHVWLVINIVGMLYHWGFANRMIPALLPNAWAYWALLMAIGFILTGHFWANKHFWYGVGVLNLIAFALIFFMPTTVGMYSSALLAITSGVPTMYAGLKG